MTDPRNLIQRLAGELHNHTSLYEGHEHALVAEARAYLAQPEPEGLTDEELTDEELDRFFQQWRDANTDAESWLTDEQERRLARAVLARYGNRTPVPGQEVNRG